MSVRQEQQISSENPDWSRESLRGFWDPGRQLLKSIRDYGRARSGLARKRAALKHRFWSAVTSCDIPLNARIEGGLLLPHPLAIVVHPDARIGPNCLLMHGATLGSRGSGSGLPVLEGHVDVGPGAAILGGVRIGAHAQIGANAVVLTDIPAGAVAVGVPAKVIVPGDGRPGNSEPASA
ncbi:serine acetyltransferase [Parvularcula oceani]|uniref:serine acetyltransferase n=1 Tax=Parvularcula oceani TaxID=1247963 RepID=UPI00056A0F84|nr:serine acetyltransferase [Parvularcula oceani]